MAGQSSRLGQEAIATIWPLAIGFWGILTALIPTVLALNAIAYLFQPPGPSPAPEYTKYALLLVALQFVAIVAAALVARLMMPVLSVAGSAAICWALIQGAEPVFVWAGLGSDADAPIVFAMTLVPAMTVGWLLGCRGRMRASQNPSLPN